MGIYEGAETREISFPLGGIGTGSIGLGGNGRLMDWEIFNKPDKGSLNRFSNIMVRAVDRDGRVFAKALNGDLQKDFMGQYSKGKFFGYGFGPAGTTMAGFPHFKTHVFTGEFPIAVIRFSDDKFPGDVELTAFNPLIPMDSLNSSIPAAFFELEFSNPTEDAITYDAAFSLNNPFEQSINKIINRGGRTMITLGNTEPEESIKYGDLTIACDGGDVSAQEYWYRGGWSDKIVTFWNEFSSGGPLKGRHYDEPGKFDTCTLLCSLTLGPRQKGKARFVLSWNISNNYNYWTPFKDESGKDVTWKNYYATVFKNSIESAAYSLKNWDELYQKTLSFKNALFSSTLDPAVIDAAASNLSVLKSPTVLRLEDGTFYGWEGVHEQQGSCEGTCCHVWNYAYALCFLFPDLERSIRDIKFKTSIDENGGMMFRMGLPVGRPDHRNRTCVDGQMGTVIKVWREWKISGDNEWMAAQWEHIKTILEYAWSPKNPEKWDADKDGVLEGRQHHTLDMELFGPSSWLQGFYLGALKAAAEMAEFLGHEDKKREYTQLFEKGYAWTKENLFNGKYFIHKIDLNDKSIVEQFDAMQYWNEEAGEIKYQIGEGCFIDQLCAQWHANICGLGDLFDKTQRKTALQNLYQNNFKQSMREFANPWRIFALNDESGAIICDYPKGSRKPAIPIPYCEESMHGFEYQLAGLLISEGMIDEGLTLVRAVRDRYDGEKRNPWNEIECGSNYARSLASFALLPIFSGFVFDLPKGKIGFHPLVGKDAFKCFWAAGGAWGTVNITPDKVVFNISGGSIRLGQLELPFLKRVGTLLIDGKETPFTLANGVISFEPVTISREVVIACSPEAE